MELDIFDLWHSSCTVSCGVGLCQSYFVSDKSTLAGIATISHSQLDPSALKRCGILSVSDNAPPCLAIFGASESRAPGKGGAPAAVPSVHTGMDPRSSSPRALQ